MKNLIKFIIIVLISVSSMSCARIMPIYNVGSSPISFDITEEKVGKSIIKMPIPLAPLKNAY